jgi:uncharacterized protein
MTVAALALLAACAGAKEPPPPQPAPKPALWKLADADTTIYLFGTIHVLPKDYDWRTPAFDKAVAQSQALVLEVADTENTAQSAQDFLGIAISPGQPPVVERVPEAKRAQLKLLIDKAGVPAQALDQFESWAVAITLAAGMLKELNVSPDFGVERLLTAEFKAKKKPISGLETSAYQLGLFDKLPEAAQRGFLVSMVDESANPKAEFDSMIAAWSRGDEKAIALTFDDEVQMTPELLKTLLVNRNRNWTDWLVKRLDAPGTVLVAVGAGHLAGKDSVQAMLAERGLRVTRVQ